VAVDDPALSRACLQARVAVSLTFFAGLRPGEARGLEWTDYDGQALYVRRSVWGKHSTEPKTRSSIARVPVEVRLKAVLDELHAAEGKPKAGPILPASRNGAPLDLHNLAARVIRPVLTKAGVEWKGGFYANRRGLASTCVEIGLNPIAARARLSLLLSL
jgi:integrase